MINLLCQTDETICVSQHIILTVKILSIEQAYFLLSKLGKQTFSQYCNAKAEYFKFQVII